MGVTLRRPAPRRMALSVVSMIDVMMILLFFFMITSSYLNLDMVPALEKSEASGEAAAGAGGTALLVRVSADSTLSVQGRRLGPADFETFVAERLASEPLTEVLIFPSGAASLQALVEAMDAVTRAGARRVKVIRIEAAP